jgi:head-tail adaptor
MDIGPLDKRGRIERKTITKDADYGSPVITWTLVGVAWCGVQDMLPSKSDAVANNMAISTGRTRVRMRYRSDITSEMRIVINRPEPTIYQIVAGPAELGNKDGIEMMVEKFTTAGGA